MAIQDQMPCWSPGQLPSNAKSVLFSLWVAINDGAIPLKPQSATSFDNDGSETTRCKTYLVSAASREDSNFSPVAMSLNLSCAMSERTYEQ